MRIYVIRHGETDANVRGILVGRTDWPLNEKGRALARITGRALREVRFDRVFTSPLSRARETAQIMLAENAHPHVPTEVDARLIEIAFGAWECQGLGDDAVRLDRARFSTFFEAPFDFEPAPGGETVRAVCDRTADFLRALLARKDLKDAIVLVSTHGCATRALLNPFYDDPTDFWHGRVPDNCAVNVIEADESGARLVGEDRLFYDPALAVNNYT